MKLINSSVEILEQPEGIQGIYKQIETAGRVCYKSEDKITEGSATQFVDRMVKLGHGAMLEHGAVYLKISDNFPSVRRRIARKYRRNKYSIVHQHIVDDELVAFITTNFRVLVENGWTDDLKHICEPTEHHEKRVTVKWTCDRVTGESFLRHKILCVAQW